MSDFNNRIVTTIDVAEIKLVFTTTCGNHEIVAAIHCDSCADNLDRYTASINGFIPIREQLQRAYLAINNVAFLCLSTTVT